MKLTQSPEGLPVGMRNWNRHILTLPGNNYAYNSGGNIAFFGTTSGNMDVAVHETGHSLDLLGAYPDTGASSLSGSQLWIDNYNMDSNVPDNYARTNQVENVAQNTVVSVYDKNVPNGFGGAQPNWNNIFHQYATLQSKAGNQILPGGTCDRKLVNSAPVPMSDSARVRSAEKMDLPFAQPFKGNYSVLENPATFNTKTDCKFGI